MTDYAIVVHERSAHWTENPVTVNDDETGEPITRLSVNLPDAPDLPEGMFWLKDWSENRSIVDELLEQGRIEIDFDIPTYPSGFVDVYAARILK